MEGALAHQPKWGPDEFPEDARRAEKPNGIDGDETGDEATTVERAIRELGYDREFAGRLMDPGDRDVSREVGELRK